MTPSVFVNEEMPDEIRGGLACEYCVNPAPWRVYFWFINK
jgi:hypothetical protein